MKQNPFKFHGRSRPAAWAAVAALTLTAALTVPAANIVNPVGGSGVNAGSPATFNFQNVPVEKILQLYAMAAGVELVGATNIPPVKISGSTTSTTSASDAVLAIKKLLQDQAGVVFKPLDEKRVAVSYDPKLKVH